MIDIVGKKFWYFALSLLVIIPGIVALFIWGLNLGIDFTGGTLTQLSLGQQIDRTDLERTIESSGIEVSTIAESEGETYLVRTKPLSEEEQKKLVDVVKKDFPNAKSLSHETIGPTVGSELLRKSILALGITSLAIILYIAWAFRKVPKPASSWRFGISAVIALLHDVVFVVGLFAVLGHFFAVEIDALFVTALLTILGFSVHDTIVVFDRIRENLNKGVGVSFADTVNHSIMQTIVRSLGTSITVVLVLLPVLLFGGASIRWFAVALLVGVVSGTYSSIFNAAALLVAWQDWSTRKAK